MKKILFLNPPLYGNERAGALAAAAGRSIPYGLISLAAVVRKEGYAVSFLDAANFGYGTKETVERILAQNPDYVGISTVTMSIDRTAELADLLKLRNNRIKIIVGGPHLSSVPQETMQLFPSFDAGIIGEGEKTLVELLKVWDNGEPLESVQGLIYRDEKALVRTKPRAMIKNLDELPLPAWDLIPNAIDLYRPSAPSYIRLPSTTLVTSRGCFGQCIFCNSKMIHGNLRSFSAEYVLDMVRYLIKNYGVRDISIYDDNFVVNERRVRTICETILAEKLDLTWSCYSRVDQGNLELFQLMKKAGCWQISYGIESGSQRILDLIKKNVTLEQVERTVVMTKKAGLRTRGFFIIGHFGETRESILETIRFMKRLPLDDFHFTTFTPLPGTLAYDIADKYGTFDKTWSKMNLQNTVFLPHGLSADDLENYSKLAYRTFYFRPKIIMSYLWVLMRHPRNIKRLLNAFQALVSRIFSKDHNVQEVSEVTDMVTQWDDAHKYSPAPRHRRRIMRGLLKDLNFKTWLDIGCAQPYFMKEVSNRADVHMSGCDISEQQIAINKKLFPQMDFFVVDISKPQAFNEQYDLVTCSEVLEHVEDWQAAVVNIAHLSKQWLLVTVPSGKVHHIDKSIGHLRHFQGDELLSAFAKQGFRPLKVMRWGFPFHTMYKYAVNGAFSDSLLKSFGQEKYGMGKIFISNFLYGLFGVNDLFNHGLQFIALMEKKND
ncbi:MAG: cobalamin-dependent protein [Candidatus Omnitrophica bacterium]|nr:cobalamin-dependent protein [Candidatus Omnitrophota bacterium]